MSADFDTGSESDMPISAAQEASLLEISHKHADNPVAEAHPDDQGSYSQRFLNPFFA